MSDFYFGVSVGVVSSTLGFCLGTLLRHWLFDKRRVLGKVWDRGYVILDTDLNKLVEGTGGRPRYSNDREWINKLSQEKEEEFCRGYTFDELGPRYKTIQVHLVEFRTPPTTNQVLS